MTAFTPAEEAFRSAFRAALDAARGARPATEDLRPRGVIIPAGGGRIFTCAWIAVRMIRDFLGSDIPIEVWHLGDTELSPAMKMLLASQGVGTVDALALAAGEDEPFELGGFELKSYALLRCRFREVLLLDADNMPLLDPRELFQSPAFAETGAMFWPDLVSLDAASRIWELCGVTYRPMASFESGQLAIDRVRHYPALMLSWFMNRHSRIVYHHIYGDKDSFLLAWLALGAPYHLVGHPAARLYGCLCQHLPDGRRMFQHRSSRKWRLHGENPPVEGFREEARCLGYLDELRAVWNGRVFIPPPYDDEMQTVADALMRQRHFRIETVSIRRDAMQLLPGNVVLWRMPKPVCWWLVRENGAIVLCMGEDEAVSRRFAMLSQDYWRSAARDGTEQDLIITTEPDPAGLRPRGHNTDSSFTILKDWRRNYTWLPGN